VSAPVSFTVPGSALALAAIPATNRPTVSDPSAAGPAALNQTPDLDLRMAWHSNSVLLSMSARTCGAPTSPSPETLDDDDDEEEVDEQPAFAVDLSSIGQGPLLRARDTLLSSDGSWSSVSGICAVMLPQHRFAEILTCGLLCVICVRDAIGKSPVQASRGTYALHLEASGLRSARRR